jgi:hypothetical protein
LIKNLFVLSTSATTMQYSPLALLFLLVDESSFARKGGGGKGNGNIYGNGMMRWEMMTKTPKSGKKQCSSFTPILSTHAPSVSSGPTSHTASPSASCAPSNTNLGPLFFNQSVTGNIIMGTGIDDGHFTCARQNGLELCIRIRQRYPKNSAGGA